MNPEKTLKIIKKYLTNYILDNKLDGFVIGISGGLDSCLCAYICGQIADEVGCACFGRSMPIESNKPDEIYRANLVGENFCSNYKEINLEDSFHSIQHRMELERGHSKVKYDLRKGNIKARLRMIYLYDLANANNCLVVSTDNLTEYYLGFWTLNGDCGDIAPIQNLWKSEVYDLAEYIASKEHFGNAMILRYCIEANATDGLGISETDIDQIMPDWKERHSNTKSAYTEIDRILMEYVHTGKYEDMNHPVIKRHIATEFKRNWPFALPRNLLY